MFGFLDFGLEGDWGFDLIFGLWESRELEVGIFVFFRVWWYGREKIGICVFLLLVIY